MNERTELTERDRQLLKEIEEIVANGGGERREADSLYGFCAHLASTVPQADDTFRQQLEARLVSRMQQQQEVRTLGTTPEDKGEARSPSWFQRLAPGVGRINQIFEGGLTMKKGFALAAIAALVLALSVVAFVPSVRAQVREAFATWFGYVLPGGDDVATGTRVPIPDMDFTPLQPTYLPAEFVRFAEVKPDSVRLVYRGDDRFVDVTQSKAPADRTLPAGREVTINGQPAVLVTGLEGTFEFGPGIPEGVTVQVISTPPAEPLPHPISIAYTDGKRLTWYVGDVEVEMLSNLSEEEMLKIAASLAPWEGVSMGD